VEKKRGTAQPSQGTSTAANTRDKRLAQVAIMRLCPNVVLVRIRTVLRFDILEN